MEEYRMATLSQVMEAYSFWKSQYNTRALDSVEVFADIFGHLIKDDDKHFQDFSNDVGKCDAMDIISLLTLMSTDNIQAKFRFLFHMQQKDGMPL